MSNANDLKVLRLKELFPSLTVDDARIMLLKAKGDPTIAAHMVCNGSHPYEERIPSFETISVSGERRQISITPRIRSPQAPIKLCNGYIGDHTPNRPSTSSESRTLSVQLKLTISLEGLPRYLALRNLKRLIMDSKGVVKSCGRLTSCLQAAYEEKCVDVQLMVDLNYYGDNEDDVFMNFVKSFLTLSGFYLEAQPWMEIRYLNQVFLEMKADHENINITSITFGNMPNKGLYFIRGEYVTDYNRISNRFLQETVSDSQINHATGCRMLLSWAHFEHDKRMLTIFFAIEKEEEMDGLRYHGYKMHLPYNAFNGVVIDCNKDNDESNNYMYIRIRYPPQLWKAEPRLFFSGRRILNLETCQNWIRAVQWPGNLNSAGCSRKAFAYSSWMCISMPKEAVQPESMYPNEVLEWNNRMVTEKMLPTRQLFEIAARFERRTKCPINFASIMKVSRREPAKVELVELPTFRAKYSLEALMCKGGIVTDQLLDVVPQSENLFFERLLYASKECLRACEETLDEAVRAADEKRHFNVLKFFEHTYMMKLRFFQNTTSSEEVAAASNIPRNCIMIRKIIATPTRLMILPPETMMTNRVVRYFGEEFALRCVFRDDNGQRLVPNDFSRGRNVQDQSTLIANTVYETLIHGVNIASRHFNFLAWSNSQMRDHGCYMYANAVVADGTGGSVCYTVEDIRRWMGDFTASRNIPKLMSRMGQCFTQAQPSIVLHRENWLMEDDIYSEHPNPETGETYIFSDGVGRISQKYAKQVAKTLDIFPVPSCFQVRFKGFKGVLCQDPLLDLLGKKDIIFRKSQKKFEEDDGEPAALEIVKYSMPSPVCLNRPLIMILDQVAEKQSWELHRRLRSRLLFYLEKELANLANMLLCEKDATEALATRLSLPIDFRQLHMNCFTFTDEPFFRSLLIAIHRYNIRHLLTKSKIFLPGNVGRTLYGVIDDTGLLQYGQVFIQISPNIRHVCGQAVTITGPVLVTKNPCHVAGDVRIFEAVYQDALSHLCDVVVFPRYGPRPHPDEMAGSDLDGDEYTVIFDKDLFFERNERAMTFPKQKPEEYESLPTTEDMINFFLKYIRQDSIGRMSNAHLIMSDRLGLFHPICDEIALKCSVSVDFPKTGQPAEPLTFAEQSEFVPDYMQNSVKPSYRSKRLLGELFRKAKKVEDIVEGVQDTIYAGKRDGQLLDEDLFYQDKALMATSLRLRDEYNARLQQLLDEYGIADEGSIVSGHSLTIKRITDMEKDNYSFYHADKIVELRYNSIYNFYRNEFFKEFGNESEFISSDASGRRTMRWNAALLKKAKAWYTVTYSEQCRASSGFKSFPWIAWDLLLIAKRQLLLIMLPSSLCVHDPIATKLEGAIERFYESECEERIYFLYELSCGKRRLDSFVRYVKKYGDKIRQLGFVIYNWLRCEELYEKSPVKREHAVILFLQFGIGILHGKRHADDLMNKNQLYFEKVDYALKGMEKVDLIHSTGEILLAFLRYLASADFGRANLLRFSLGNMLSGYNDGLAITFTHPSQWAMLHAVAYRAYHHIAATANFESLHIMPRTPQRKWDFGESETPAIISSRLLSHKDIGLQRILISLKEWSGVQEITCRPTRRDRLLVSCTGTVAGRQRLNRLLLMKPERLFEAIETGSIPNEARDEYF